MDTLERISEWIQEQKDKGRNTDDLDGTVFVLSNDNVARISYAGGGQFDIEILLHPYAVDFTRN